MVPRSFYGGKRDRSPSISPPNSESDESDTSDDSDSDFIAYSSATEDSSGDLSSEDEDDNCEPVPLVSETVPASEASNQWSESVLPILNFNFDGTNVGPQMNINADHSPRQIFDMLFNREIINMLLESTNIYGTKFCAFYNENRRVRTRTRKPRSFRVLDEAELRKFLS